MQITKWITEASGDDVEVTFAAHYVVCSTCEGRGTHVDRSVDGKGLSAEQMDEDPDFREAYLSGAYDVRCEDCNGERVVLEVDMDQLNEEEKQSIYRREELDARDRAETDMERCLGC